MGQLSEYKAWLQLEHYNTSYYHSTGSVLLVEDVEACVGALVLTFNFEDKA